MKVMCIARMVLLSIIPLGWSNALGQCTTLNARSSVTELISFLRNSDLPEKDPACVNYAIQQLQYRRSPDAIPVLIDYLNFERPLTELEKGGFTIHGSLKSIGNRYPATETLFVLGKPALLPLVAAVKTRESSVIRRNATYTIMQIFRTEPVKGIELLKREVSSSGEGSGAANLRRAMTDAVQWCPPEDQEKCKSLAQSEGN